ncbi:MAG: efflux RND transporter periplasmic adaptor subunit [Planctomycetes bacterium]|nr:efflux RND transporter periplasmic adaptor subunit [Planctomycetota bacterium]
MEYVVVRPCGASARRGRGALAGQVVRGGQEYVFRDGCGHGLCWVESKVMRRLLVVFGLLVVIGVSVGIANMRRDKDGFDVDWRIPKPLPVKAVQMEQPRRCLIIQTVTAPGTIELVEEAKIASQIIGQVETVAVRKGDRVKKGDLLVKLDDEDARARLESTEARIKRLGAAIALARADLEKAMRDSEGFQQLSDRGFSTPTEVLDGVTNVAKTTAALQMGEHELTESLALQRASQQELDRTEILAPIPGTVIDLDVEVGEVVIAGTTNLPGTVLMTIADMERVRVRADVDETDVGLVRRGQKSRIFLQADQDDPIPGTVDLISPKGTKVNEVVSFETLITVDGVNEMLRPEMTATVEIEVRRADDALSLPVQAVVHRRLKDLPDTRLFRDWVASQPETPSEKGKDESVRYVKVVFVVKDGKAVVRPVKTGISDAERIEIESGLDADDTVIAGPFRALDELEDGQPVRLENERDRAKSGESGGPTGAAS